MEINSSTLRILAEKAGKFIGAAVDPNCLNEKQYADTLSLEFNMIVPENHLKWINVHPSKDKYDFSASDKIVSFAQCHNMKIKGHTLLWHNQNPQWLENGKWTKEEAEKILEGHINKVVGRYAGQIQYWDVANEVISEDGSGDLRKTLWSESIGRDYIEKAFIYAHRADPEAKLFINEYGAEEINVKSDALYKLVKELLKKGVPVDGVGFQCHLELAKTIDYRSFERNMKRFIGLGLEIYISEMDVAISGKVEQKKLQQQAEVFGKVMEIALKYPQIRSVSIWGVTDKYSWFPWFQKEIKKSDVPYGSGFLFDSNYAPKPAYFTVKDKLQGH